MFNNMYVWAQGASKGAHGGQSMVTSFVIPMLFFFAIMYFLLIRPQNKKDKAVKEMLAALKPGDEVVTYSGLKGKVIRVGPDEIVIEVMPAKIRLTHMKFAIREVINPANQPEEKVPEKDIGKVVAEDDDYIYEEVDENESGKDVTYIEVDEDKK